MHICAHDSWCRSERWFIRDVSTFLSPPPPLRSTTDLPQTTLRAMTEHFHYSLFRILKQTRTDRLLLSSSLPSLIHHPHAHAHAKILLGFLCQLHMRWCHCLHPLTMGARKCFPISFICHCSFPSSAGCLTQFVNWFIMLSIPAWGGGWGKHIGGCGGMGAGSGCDVAAAMKTYTL